MEGFFKPNARDLGLEQRETQAATTVGLEALHDAAYIAALAEPVGPEGREIDGDTHLSPGSFEAALHSVGGALLGVDCLLGGHADTAFVATRPPGHHALADRAMGFCLFGNAALAAHAAGSCGARVAVLDFDVHHGNGTQALLWDAPNTFFASTHQLSAWPGTGRRDEVGAHGTILNRPLKSGAGSRRMREAWTEILDAARTFAPDIVIVSAGFDAHQHDPLGGFSWADSDYHFLGNAIREMAQTSAQGRVLSLLEGGYDLGVLRRCGRAYLEGLIFG